ncbi:MAG: hypothetical protein HY237_12645 [Acidobacteria bacterium]|nr:hypothetical protein [Acidobacteriota bacterium]
MTRRMQMLAGISLLWGSYGLVGGCKETGPPPGPANSAVVAVTQRKKPEAAPREVVVYASDLPKSALSEFDFWNAPASPGGRMVGTPNNGDQLDPPPENDPNVAFKVEVQRGVPYRCWIHMKVGAPKGKSQANILWVQFSDAVDKANKEVFKPGTGSYLTARGPAREGWTWVGCAFADPKSSEPLIYFRTSGEVTVRLQAGMEGVGFDQFLLSPAQFLEKPPSEAVVKK